MWRSRLYRHHRSGVKLDHDLRNTTDSDYGLVNEKEIEVLFKKGNSLRQWPGIAVLDLPIFIPAGKTVATNIHFNLEDAENPNVVEFSHSSDEGFVLFDKTHRYQVEFPKRPDVSRSSENNELIR